MAREKRCKGPCNEVKPLDDFYKNPTASDGHEGKCKDCRKERQHFVRRQNIEHYREYEQKRNRTPKRRVWYKARYWRGKFKEEAGREQQTA